MKVIIYDELRELLSEATYNQVADRIPWNATLVINPPGEGLSFSYEFETPHSPATTQACNEGELPDTPGYKRTRVTGQMVDFGDCMIAYSAELRMVFIRKK